MQPELIVLCGPNGSGKSSIAAGLDTSRLAEVINPDTICDNEGKLLTPLAAGRTVIARTEAHLAKGNSFLLETTFSGNREIRLIEHAVGLGYCVELIFVCLENVNLNVRRVKQRAGRGGHDVPEADIRRRYERSLQNLKESLPAVQRATLIDNSEIGARVVATFEAGLLTYRANPSPAWLARVLD